MTTNRPTIVSLPTLALLFWTVVLVYGVFVSGFGGPLFDYSTLGTAYDSLGDNLVKFNAEVGEDDIGWEAWVVDGRTYMYFGCFPALLRAVLNFVFPGVWGMWTPLACLAAGVTAVAGWTWLVLSALRRSEAPLSLKRMAFYLSFVAFAFCSSLFYLLASPCLYHEAVLWGFSCSVCALGCIFHFWSRSEWSAASLFGYSTFAAVALLSRATYGLPLYLVLTFLVFTPVLQVVLTRFNIASGFEPGSYIDPTSMRKTGLRLAALVVPATLALAIAGWYNHARFGSVFLFEDHNMKSYIHASTYAELFSRYPEFSWHRLPDNFYNYFLRVTGYFRPTAPFVDYVFAEAITTEKYNVNSLQEVMSIPFGTPWLILGGLGGVAVMLVRFRTSWFGLVLGCLLLVQWLLLLQFMAIVQRFVFEFYPLLLLGVGVCLRFLPSMNHYLVRRLCAAFIALRRRPEIT